jgi:hypothetical protein
VDSSPPSSLTGEGGLLRQRQPHLKNDLDFTLSQELGKQGHEHATKEAMEGPLEPNDSHRRKVKA